MAASKHPHWLIYAAIGLLLSWVGPLGTISAVMHSIGFTKAGIAIPLQLNEPDVALTDYAVAIECLLFTYLLFGRRHGSRLATWFALFFLSTGVASIAGGTSHGFFPDGTSGDRIVWLLTMFAIGCAALTAWMIGTQLLSSPALARWLSILATVVFCLYCAVVLFVSQIFLVAIIDYLPAAVFLLGIFGLRYWKRRERAVLVGVLGLLLTFVAAYVQQAKIGLDPQYFNGNALYHLIQAVALAMFFVSGRQLIATMRTTIEPTQAPSAYAA